MNRTIALFFLFILIHFSVSAAKVIHIFVSLCDNKYQGIVPVPAKIGNGQDPFNNLYWGCGYGVKTFFKNSSEWKMVKEIKNPTKEILERCIFKHKTTGTYLVADAYDGMEIKKCTVDYLEALSGNNIQKIKIDSTLTIEAGGGSQLLGYVGHDGLMDFTLDNTFTKKNEQKRESIILACYSKSYFKDYVKSCGAEPLLWSSHLMSPEAYTLEAAIKGWLLNEDAQSVRKRAATAYDKYLHCGIKGATNLLVTGW